MRIAAAEVVPWCLPLARPVTTAHGRLTRREGFRVHLRDADGRVGRGESAPLPAFGTESLAAARDALEAVLARLDAYDPEEPLAALASAEAALAAAPTARAALDGALHELASRHAGLPLAAWLARRADRPARSRVVASRLLVESEPALVEKEARGAVEAGFSALKLKVGGADDEARVAAARRGAGRAPRLGVDANGAWSAAAALARIEALAPHGLDHVEQPVPARDLPGLAFVRARSPVPIAADESVLRLADARAVLDARAADRLVLKPAALGGVAAASHVAGLAREAGVAVAVTSFLDGGVGLHAALHFAASLPDPLPPCGLATGDLLLGDPVPPPRPREGALVVPDAPGLGGAGVPR